MTSYTFTTINYPGFTQTQASGINDAGSIVGKAVFNNFIPRDYYSVNFLYDNGSFSQITDPITSNFYLTDVSAENIIIGNALINGNYHGFIDNNGTFSTIDAPNALATYVYGINASGQIVGSYLDSNFGQHGFLDNNGVFSDIIGPGGAFASISNISDDGTISGIYAGGGIQHGFTEKNGIFTTIDFPGATSTTVSGSNTSGEIVGYYTDSQANTHGFTDINGQFTTINYPNSTYTTVTRVTNNGELLGDYTDATGNHSFTAAAAAPFVVAQTATVVDGDTIKGTAGITGTGALAHDSDPSGGTLSVTAINGGTIGQAVAGTYGHLTLNADGSYVYVADNTASLTSNSHDVFTFTVGDGQGGTTASTLDVTVEHLNAAYRFFDTHTGDHFYTTSATEAAQIKATIPFYNYESIPWATPDKGADTVDVFRFFDTKTGTHFYTANTGERDGLIKNPGTYQYEGVAFEAFKDAASAGSGADTLDRFFNTITGQHHMAGNATEAYNISHGSAGPGWVEEGLTFTVHNPTDAMLHA